MNEPWNDFLAAQGARLSPDAVAFSDPASEVARAAAGDVLVPLQHLGLIRASGEDAISFLHSIGSNDVKKLGTGRAQHNSLNSPKGRMLASFIVWRDGTDLLLALSADLQTAISKKLSMYVLRAKVKISDATEARVLLGLSGPRAAALLEGAGLAAPDAAMGVTPGETRVIHLDTQRFIIDCPAALAPQLWQRLAAGGAQASGTTAWRWLDISAGLPLITSATQDEFVAQMLNFELLGGVNFQKGCYPGQEIVARTQYLGKLKKRMFRAHVTDQAGAAMGADLFSPEFGEQSCGKLISVEPAPDGGADLLAVMQIAAFESGQVHLGRPDGPALQLAALPYTVD